MTDAFTYDEKPRDTCIPIFQLGMTQVVEDGVPRFVEEPWVEILTPGDNLTKIKRPVKEADKERWPRHWEAFQKKQEPPVDGFPLSEWPACTLTDRNALASFGVKSVEQLAELSENALQRFPPNTLSLKQKARLWLTHRTDDSALFKLQAELAAEKDKNEALSERMSLLATRLDELESKPKKVKKRVATDGRSDSTA